MENNRFAGYAKSKKPKKIIAAICIVVVLLLSVIAAIGMTLGSNSSEGQAVADAVKENAELKRQINELEARPTVSPTPAPEFSPMPSKSPAASSAPRNIR